MHPLNKIITPDYDDDDDDVIVIDEKWCSVTPEVISGPEPWCIGRSCEDCIMNIGMVDLTKRTWFKRISVLRTLP